MKRSSSFVGVVALFFSITVGGYTIWEKAVVEPRKSEASKTEDIRRIVSRIGELNRQVIDAQYENVAKAAALGRLANGEKLGLLSKAESIIESIEHRFDFSEYFVLAFEQLNAGNNELAIRYYELAYQAAPKDLPKAEALRGYAQAVFAQGPNQDIDYTRTQFQKALNHASKAKTYVALASQLNIYVAWTVSEIFFGDCDKATSLFKELLSRRNLQSVAAREFEFAKSSIFESAGGQLACRNKPHW